MKTVSVKVPAVPAGKILIQVIAKGLHTFGKWYDIEDKTPLRLKSSSIRRRIGTKPASRIISARIAC